MVTLPEWINDNDISIKNGSNNNDCYSFDSKCYNSN